MTKIKKKDIEIKVRSRKGVLKPKEIQELPIIVHYEVVKLIKEFVVTGHSKTYIREFIKNDYNVTDSVFDKCYTQSLEHLQRSMVESQFLTDVVHTHILDYEEIYKFFDKIDFLSGKMKALFQKEKLLGFHKDSNVLEINQNNTTVIEVDVDYNFNKLSEEERQRVEFLLDKIQINKK